MVHTPGNQPLPPNRRTRLSARFLLSLLFTAAVLGAVPWCLSAWLYANGLAVMTRIPIAQGVTAESMLPDIGVERDINTSVNAVFASYDNQDRVTIIDFRTPAKAYVQWAQPWDEKEYSSLTGSRFEAGGEHLYRGRVKGYEFIQWTNGPWFFQLAAMSKAGLEELIYATPEIEMRGEPGYTPAHRSWLLLIAVDYPWAGSLLIVSCVVLVFISGRAILLRSARGRRLKAPKADPAEH